MALVFLPWIRLGIGALNTTHTKQEAGKDGNIVVLQTARRNIEVESKVKDKPGNLLGDIRKSFTLKGPGEVLGFSDQAIALTEPVVNETSFAPNQIPYVDFKDADFPWRYSLEEPDAQNRLRPWLLLIVLKKGEYSELPPGRSSAMISVNSSLLPDLNESWAFSHVQLSTQEGFDPADISSYITDHPESAHSRILCTRRLQASQSYTAFLVPVYKMGIQAALELEVQDTADLAWNTGSPSILSLPYYFRWDFSTSDTGDFEDLARRIRVYDNPGIISGSRKVADSTGTEMEFEGLVLPNNRQPSDKTYNIAFSNNAIAQFNKMYNKQRPVVSAQGGEPELFIPLYGQNHADSEHLIGPTSAGTWENRPGAYNPAYDPVRSPDLWFSEGNLDRNYRYATALGASVVRYNQDDFISRCFAMAGEVKEVNQLIKRYKVLRNIRKNIVRRHLNTMDDTRFMHVTKNLQRYYTGSDRVNTTVHSTGGFSAPVHSARGVDISESFKSGRSSYPNISMNLIKSINICNSIGELRNERLMNFRDEAEKSSFMEDAQTFKSLLLNTDTAREVLNRIVTSPDRSEVGDSEIYHEPKIGEGLLGYIPQQIMKDLIPGLTELPNNSSMLLKLNREFLEAFMLGANHEMVRELIWREFPVDRRATVFNSFWGAGGANREDIKDIANWNGRLGENAGVSGSNQDNIIVAIKSDLFRRYPKTVLYAVEYDPALITPQNGWNAVINAVKQGASQTGATLHKPLFTVDVMEDLLFIYYNFTKQYMDRALNGSNPGGIRKFCFVILENVTLPKFGLDESVTANKNSLDDLSWNDFDVNATSGYLNISTMQSKLAAMNFSGAAVNRDFADAAKMAIIALNKPSGVIMDFGSIC
ncbi:MAG: hypothetical protein ABFD25_20305 [Clostridiaceae bacterium]